MRDEKNYQRSSGDSPRSKWLGALGIVFIPRPSSLSSWLERPLTFFLLLLAVAAPLSIAATQTAWLCGLSLWVARLLVRPRAGILRRTPLDHWLLGFFILTFASALLSYEPDISIGKLRAASLFTIVYLVAENVASLRAARTLAFALVASCALGVVYTFGGFAIGRGVKVRALDAGGPLASAGVREGDTLLAVDGVAVETIDDVARLTGAPRGAEEVTMRWPGGQAACVSTPREACVQAYRAEVVWPFMVERARVAPVEGAPEARLGLAAWGRGRDERLSGTYGHYTTYAEVLQLVGSLALGLLVARVRGRGWRQAPTALLGLAFAGMTAALLLTVTRASALGLLVSTFVVVAAGATRLRRALFVTALVAAPLVLAGLFVLQQKRGVGFLDPREGSTAWRLTVYREAFGVLVSRPRHLLVGVGMDSIKRRWREWGMFDGGRLPLGHLHSTPLQLAFERGLPALLCWLALLAAYARTLWRLTRAAGERQGGGGGVGRAPGWAERGLALGALSGTVGFFVSGLVHYNFGDSEVVMVFYLIMGLTLAVERLSREADGAGPAGASRAGAGQR